MLTIKGQSISGLIAIAPLHVFHPFTPDVTRKEIKDTDTEVSRFITARDTASTIMQKLHDQALSTSGADNAAMKTTDNFWRHRNSQIRRPVLSEARK